MHCITIREPLEWPKQVVLTTYETHFCWQQQMEKSFKMSWLMKKPRLPRTLTQRIASQKPWGLSWWGRWCENGKHVWRVWNLIFTCNGGRYSTLTAFYWLTCPIFHSICFFFNISTIWKRNEKVLDHAISTFIKLTTVSTYHWHTPIRKHSILEEKGQILFRQDHL